MTKLELLNLNVALTKLGNLSGVKFAYGVSKNLAILKPEMEALEKASAMTDEYKKFEEARIKIAEKYSKKDKDGKAIIKDNSYDIEEDKKEEMEKEFDILKKENEEVFNAREKQIMEYAELIKSESNVTLYKIALSDVPSNITVAQMASISSIVEEEVLSPYNK